MGVIGSMRVPVYPAAPRYVRVPVIIGKRYHPQSGRVLEVQPFPERPSRIREHERGYALGRARGRLSGEYLGSLEVLEAHLP